MDINKYVGVNFRKFGRDMTEGVDCYGLILNFYRDELGIELPDFKDYKFDPKSISEKVYFALSDMFSPVKTEGPALYDLGLLSFAGAPTHVVMYIGDLKILHIMTGEESVIERMDSPRLRGRWYGWYRQN
jgi:cell wall-associated NlpC family hydrolase